MAQIDPRALRVLRKKSRLNQAQLADLVGVSKRQVAEWERTQKDRPPVSIRAANLKRLCALLGVTEAQITGEERLDASQDDLRLHQFSVRLSSMSRLNYELIEKEYGISREHLVEAAPMLFMVLARQSLAWREQQLEQLCSALHVVQENGLELITATVGGELDQLEEELEREVQAVRNEEILTPSSMDPIHKINFSNRFADYLMGTAASSDITFDLHGPISEFPDHLVCPDTLREICGGASAVQMPRAAYALVTGNVSLADIPEELCGPESSEERCEWLAQRAPEFTGDAHWGYSFGEDEVPGMRIYL